MKHSGRGVDHADQLQILEAIDGAGHVSQRVIARVVGIPASRVNRIVRGLVRTRHVEVRKITVRPFAYRLTPKGRRYLVQLSYEHDTRVVARFRRIEERIGARLAEIRRSGAQRVVFFGAGELTEVAYPLAQRTGLQVVGVVDEGPTGTHGSAAGPLVGPAEAIRELAPDAIVITTCHPASEVRRKLKLEGGTKMELVGL